MADVQNNFVSFENNVHEQKSLMLAKCDNPEIFHYTKELRLKRNFQKADIISISEIKPDRKKICLNQICKTEIKYFSQEKRTKTNELSKENFESIPSINSNYKTLYSTELPQYDENQTIKANFNITANNNVDVSESIIPQDNNSKQLFTNRILNSDPILQSSGDKPVNELLENNLVSENDFKDLCSKILKNCISNVSSNEENITSPPEMVHDCSGDHIKISPLNLRRKDNCRLSESLSSNTGISNQICNLINDNDRTPVSYSDLPTNVISTSPQRSRTSRNALLNSLVIQKATDTTISPTEKLLKPSDFLKKHCVNNAEEDLNETMTDKNRNVCESPSSLYLNNNILQTDEKYRNIESKKFDELIEYPEIFEDVDIKSNDSGRLLDDSKYVQQYYKNYNDLNDSEEECSKGNKYFKDNFDTTFNLQNKLIDNAVSDVFTDYVHDVLTNDSIRVSNVLTNNEIDDSSTDQTHSDIHSGITQNNNLINKTLKDNKLDDSLGNETHLKNFTTKENDLLGKDTAGSTINIRSSKQAYVHNKQNNDSIDNEMVQIASDNRQNNDLIIKGLIDNVINDISSNKIQLEISPDVGKENDLKPNDVKTCLEIGGYSSNDNETHVESSPYKTIVNDLIYNIAGDNEIDESLNNKIDFEYFSDITEKNENRNVDNKTVHKISIGVDYSDPIIENIIRDNYLLSTSENSINQSPSKEENHFNLNQTENIEKKTKNKTLVRVDSNLEFDYIDEDDSGKTFYVVRNSSDDDDSDTSVIILCNSQLDISKFPFQDMLNEESENIEHIPCNTLSNSRNGINKPTSENILNINHSEKQNNADVLFTRNEEICKNNLNTQNGKERRKKQSEGAKNTNSALELKKSSKTNSRKKILITNTLEEKSQPWAKKSKLNKKISNLAGFAENVLDTCRRRKVVYSNLKQLEELRQKSSEIFQHHKSEAFKPMGPNIRKIPIRVKEKKSEFEFTFSSLTHTIHETSKATKKYSDHQIHLLKHKAESPSENCPFESNKASKSIPEFTFSTIEKEYGNQNDGDKHSYVVITDRPGSETTNQLNGIQAFGDIPRSFSYRREYEKYQKKHLQDLTRSHSTERSRDKERGRTSNGKRNPHSKKGVVDRSRSPHKYSPYRRSIGKLRELDRNGSRYDSYRRQLASAIRNRRPSSDVHYSKLKQDGLRFIQPNSSEALRFMFDKIFKKYARYKRKSNELITYKNSTKWLRDAGIIGTLLTEDKAEQEFKSYAGVKIALTNHDYRRFLYKLTTSLKNMSYSELCEKLCKVNTDIVDQ